MAASFFGRGLLLASILLGGQGAMALDVAPLWNYSDPAGSEQRFRQALAGASSDDALELQTQIARTYGLRRRFAEARQILAGIEAAIRARRGAAAGALPPRAGPHLRVPRARAAGDHARGAGEGAIGLHPGVREGEGRPARLSSPSTRCT